jgi:hypothetical protein
MRFPPRQTFRQAGVGPGMFNAAIESHLSSHIMLIACSRCAPSSQDMDEPLASDAGRAEFLHARSVWHLTIAKLAQLLTQGQPDEVSALVALPSGTGFDYAAAIHGANRRDNCGQHNCHTGTLQHLYHVTLCGEACCMCSTCACRSARLNAPEMICAMVHVVSSTRLALILGSMLVAS